ncbi:MAG: hypothetical protein LBC27_00925, partial [Spirochaetaceae bacterium]|nr:hypothetical protein [Spirochaetaceae bacterium]
SDFAFHGAYLCKIDFFSISILHQAASYGAGVLFLSETIHTLSVPALPFSGKRDLANGKIFLNSDCPNSGAFSPAADAAGENRAFRSN